jgi:endonuclease YncB( thermonuclease family)
VRNYDGDTFTVNIPGVPELIGRNISVRVRGIDTPEIKGRGACEKEAARMAKKFLSSQLRAASKVHLKGIERDKYFRILADVEVDGEDLAMKLKNAKLAVPYKGGRKEQVNWCQRLGLKEPWAIEELEFF